MSITLQALGIRYKAGELNVLDQQALPHSEVWLDCHCIDDMCHMIQALKVRGAPLIGLAAVLALMQYAEKGANANDIRIAAKQLIATRPTAVNIQHYMQTILSDLQTDTSVVLTMGACLFHEDVELCKKMAHWGSLLLPANATVMTYCNTGGLATAGYGTALGVIKAGFNQGKVRHVFACETWPLLQGSHLTTWELAKADIPHTLICDNMAAMVMAEKQIDAIFVGADRIAANGDTANKIGTYSLAILAHYHHIPFYVVAPSTTLDLNCASGNGIKIEQRSPEEVKGAPNSTPVQCQAYNPSFDVTPHQLVTGYILDTGHFKTIPDSLTKVV